MKKKTHKATAKRFKVSASGKILHGHQGNNSHLKTNKNSSQKRRKQGTGALSAKGEKHKVLNLLSLK